jgi:hypothetical protein
MALMAVECSRRYIETRFSDYASELIPRYDRYLLKLRDAGDRHEHFLAYRPTDE